MDPGKIFQIITNSTLLATRLLSGDSREIEFSEPRYCLLIPEDAPPSTPIVKVTATNKQGVTVRYSITAGNRDGLFTIHQRSGLITLAAHLDYELQTKHELVVAAEAGGRPAHSIVHVSVTDVNDNPPRFDQEDITVTVVEEEHEHLPATIARVWAEDPDSVDRTGLVYSLGGDGVDAQNSKSAVFTINSLTGDLIQLKSVDRDPPNGRPKWTLKVQVRDGQRVSPSLAATSLRKHRIDKNPSAGGDNSLQHQQSLTRGLREIIIPRNPPPALAEGSSSSLRSFPNGPEEEISSRILSSGYGEPERQQQQKEEAKDIHRTTKASSNSGKLSSEDRKSVYAFSPFQNSKEFLPGFYFYHSDKIENQSNLKDPKIQRVEERDFDSTLVSSKKTDAGATLSKTRIFDATSSESTGFEGNLGRKEITRKYINKSNEVFLGTYFNRISPRSKNGPMDQRLKRTEEKRKKNKKKKKKNKENRQDKTHQASKDEDREETKPREGGEAIKRGSPPEPERSTGGGELVTSSSAESSTLSAVEENNSKIHRKIKSLTGEEGTPLGYYSSLRKKHQRKIHTRVRRKLVLTNEKETSNVTRVNSSSSLSSSSKAATAAANDLNESNCFEATAHDDKRYKLKPFRPFKSLLGKKSFISETQADGFKSEEGGGGGAAAAGLAYRLQVGSIEEEREDGIQVSSKRSARDAVLFTEDESLSSHEDDLEELLNNGLVTKIEGCQEFGAFKINPDDDGDDEEEEGGSPLHHHHYNRKKTLGQEHLWQVHVVETVVTVVVKDINDNAPLFPNTTIYGEVQENGPIDLPVCVVAAWDRDDEDEGGNAQLTYAIEKNVVEERSGRAIFSVHPRSGLIQTAVCCLDRETTPEYHLQVVALDGEGLKGTGVVLVRLADVNDNSPRLSRKMWEVEVEETWGDNDPFNTTIVTLTTSDPDTSNYFFYRIVEDSGWGWSHFGIRTVGSSGEIFARQSLDYENPAHRRDFRFLVEVTDRGRGGWKDARHTDTALVVIHLTDVNDNPPRFRRPHAHITVSEDTAPGTLLASLPAIDPDKTGEQRVSYRIFGGWGALAVDEVGGVRLWRALDREAPGGEEGIARVVGVDEGTPPLSSTATLTVTVTDVNDTPPRLLPPVTLHVREETPAKRVGVLMATDDDVWALGHGPPFNFTLASSNPSLVLQLITLKYLPGADSSRGGAELWTKRHIDRERHRSVTVEVVVTDAGGLAAAHPVTIIVDDINDNPMKPASKTVFLWKMQGGGLEAGLGRVYVQDGDDCDLEDKTFSWVGPPHPLFTLHLDTGDIYASPQVREGRYDLQFSVEDSIWGQRDVRANVTVVVKYLAPEALAHAVPVTLTPTTPEDLTKGWTPMNGGGGLGTLARVVKDIVGEDDTDTVEIVSVYGPSPPFASPNLPKERISSSSSSSSSSYPADSPAIPSASVWVSVRKTRRGTYMDPVRLQGLLALHLQRLETVMNLRVDVEDSVGGGDATINAATSSFSPGASSSSSNTPSSSVASLASKALPLQVVDTNSTSLVTPRLSRAHDCHTHHAHHVDDTCTPTSCLNGGRCIRTDSGDRCVCPGGSWGPRCKVLSRSFSGTGWAWVRPLQSCFPTTLSIRVISHKPDALLLYSGPLASTINHPRHPPTPLLLLQLVQGRPQVVIEGARGPLQLQVNRSLDVDAWHTIHLLLDSQGVVLMVDLCGHGWNKSTRGDSHCVARASWPNSDIKGSIWGTVSSGTPLQVGGLAHPAPNPENFGWSTASVKQALQGCISHLTVNGHIVDLGEPAHSSSSEGGCLPQKTACKGGCGFRGHCAGGLMSPVCECDAGYEGKYCQTPTVPAALNHASYVKVALSFTPGPYTLTAQLRVRAWGRPHGLLLQLAAHNRATVLALHLQGGVACASVTAVATWASSQAVCVDAAPLGDGIWHTVRIERHGHNLIITVDDGDAWRHNETLASLSIHANRDMPMEVTKKPVAILVDKQDGIMIGGIPTFEGAAVTTVDDDLEDVCIDDVRVSGVAIPLPPALNGTSWGQVTSVQNVEEGCPSYDLCSNSTCAPPYTCHDAWRHSTCSCGPGRQVVGSRCLDVDECIWEPCLHGGTCINQDPGYQCLCGPAHAGHQCQWTKMSPEMHPLTAPMAIAALTLSLLIFVVLGVLLTLRLHQARMGRGGGSALRPRGLEGMLVSPVDVQGHDPTAHTRQQQEISKNTDLIGALGITLNSKQLSLKQKGTRLDEAAAPTDPAKEVASKDIVNLGSSKSSKKRSKGHSHRRSSSRVTIDAGEDKTVENIPSISCVVGARTSDSDIGGIDSACGAAAKVDCSSSAVDVSNAALVIDTAGSGSVACVCSDAAAAASAVAWQSPGETEEESSVLQSAIGQDDLRAYAYEGDGSPSGSFTSTVLGMHTESLEEDTVKPLTPEYVEVLDLLNTLPDAVNTNTVIHKESSLSCTGSDDTTDNKSIHS